MMPSTASTTSTTSTARQRSMKCPSSTHMYSTAADSATRHAVTHASRSATMATTATQYSTSMGCSHAHPQRGG